ncbi:MAG: DEAD/DEAH box helicase [Pirellulaceae bacterium]
MSEPIETTSAENLNAITDGMPAQSLHEAYVVDAPLLSPEIARLLAGDSDAGGDSDPSDPIEMLSSAYDSQSILCHQPPTDIDDAKAPSATSVESNAQPEAKQDPMFKDLQLSPEVQRAIEQTGYDKPTAIQAKIIPYMLQQRDLLAQSQTGTGKTAAFALPILSQINLRAPTPEVLVLTPTRELAIQVAKSFSTYGNHIPGFAVCAIYGGQDYEVQFRQLRRGVQVVVGTPGRVIDHINRGTLDLDGIRCLVLDEADEMLNMGFLEDVEYVLERAPAERQIALFSATLPAPIRAIAERYLNDPAKVTIKKKTMTAESIRQRALFVPQRDKIEALTRILEVEKTDGVIVFTKTRESTITVAEELTRAGLAASPINGDMPQKVRERTIEQLKSGQLDILVATDVAARGLDVQRISHVFNFDLPHDSESYVHRIGRTGRAGEAARRSFFYRPINATNCADRACDEAADRSYSSCPLPMKSTRFASNASRIRSPP